MILDTTAIIDLLRGEAGIKKRIAELEANGMSFSTTAISVFEVWQGVKQTIAEEKKEKVINLFDSLGVFPLDKNAAKEAGIIQVDLKHAGNEIDPEDSMIAGIARMAEMPVLTKNTKHFQRIRSLKVETY